MACAFANASVHSIIGGVFGNSKANELENVRIRTESNWKTADNTTNTLGNEAP
jgi:hypothetical protein